MAREIQVRIDHCLELWEKGIYSDLVGDVFAEGRAREGCVKSREEDKEDRLAHSFHSTFLSGNL